MLHECKAEFTVKVVDNGFILEWKIEEDPQEKRRRSAVMMSGDLYTPRTFGIEIFDNQENLLKRIEGFL